VALEVVVIFGLERVADLAGTCVLRRDGLSTEGQVADLGNFHGAQVDNGHKVERERIVVRVGRVVLGVARVEEDLGETAQVVGVVASIVPRVDNHDIVSQLQAFDLPRHQRVLERNGGRLVQLQTVHRCELRTRHLFVVDNLAVRHVDDDLEEARGVFDVIHPVNELQIALESSISDSHHDPAVRRINWRTRMFRGEIFLHNSLGWVLETGDFEVDHDVWVELLDKIDRELQLVRRCWVERVGARNDCHVWRGKRGDLRECLRRRVGGRGT
jgi:hypothetical protein